MTTIPSIPEFTVIPGADPASRQAMLTCYRATKISQQLAALDRAHTRVLPLLTDLNSDLAAEYVKATREFRTFLQTLVAEVNSIHAFASSTAVAFIEQRMDDDFNDLIRRLENERDGEDSSGS